MAKRAAAACHPPPQVSQRPQRRRKKTPDDAAAAAASASDLHYSSTTSSRAPGLMQADQEPDAAPHRARTQAERRPRRGKKPSTARGLRRSCASATATEQDRLRHGALSLSWGAKRSRIVKPEPALVGRSTWRDWAGLDEGPAGLIADRVLANDVADYVRFRAACLPWRRCCMDPRARGVLDDPRLYPRHWIMVRDDYEYEYEMLGATVAPDGSCSRRFLNTHTGRCVQVDVPELQDHDVLRATSTADGLLVLRCKTSKAVRLLNPLTRQAAELPPTEYTPWCAGLLDPRTVFLYLYHNDYPGNTIAIARPGDDCWALIGVGPAAIKSMIFFAGRFYGVTYGGIVTVDMAGDDDSGPRLVVAAQPPMLFPLEYRDTLHLVDNGDGDLRLVHRKLRRIRGYDGQIHDEWDYRVYRVNFSTRNTMRCYCRHLGGRAIFIDFNCGVSVSPRVFPFLRADTIYLGLQWDKRQSIWAG